MQFGSTQRWERGGVWATWCPMRCALGWPPETLPLHAGEVYDLRWVERPASTPYCCLSRCKSIATEPTKKETRTPDHAILNPLSPCISASNGSLLLAVAESPLRLERPLLKYLRRRT